MSKTADCGIHQFWSEKPSYQVTIHVLICLHSIFRTLSVKEIKIHPDFDISEITYDYAIVKTAEEIDFTYGVNAACLPGVKDSKLTDGKFRFCNA
jgi:hypothetical protein